MAPIDWSWTESYNTPALLMMPQHPTNFNMLTESVTEMMTPQSHPSNHGMAGRQTAPQDVPAAPRSSRKRSRDDMGWCNDDESSRSSSNPFPSSRPTPSPPKHDLVTGPGMTLIHPGASMVDVSSQTGVWAEELSERLRSSGLTRGDATFRPALESRKSMRMNRSEDAAKDVAAAAESDEARFASGEDAAIDEATLALGIGWKTVAATPTMDAASRGWARHIEKSFPLQSVKILWKCNSIPAYLVEAVTCDGRERAMSPGVSPDARSLSPWNRRVGSPGYFLFDELLNQGRMVAKSWNQTIENLKAVPVVFEGEAVMQADENEVVKHSERSSWQQWVKYLRTSKSPGHLSPVVQSVDPGADGMDLD